MADVQNTSVLNIAMTTALGKHRNIPRDPCVRPISVGEWTNGCERSWTAILQSDYLRINYLWFVSFLLFADGGFRRNICRPTDYSRETEHTAAHGCDCRPIEFKGV